MKKLLLVSFLALGIISGCNNAGAPPQLALGTTSLPAATVNSAYSQTLQSSGGTPPVTWSITTGTLPQGLTLNGTTGVISGTPTTAGMSNFTVKVTDSSTPPQSASQPLSMTIRPTLSITTTSLPNGTVGTAYSQTLQFNGGTLPVTWSITTGTLPAGLSLNGSTGVISGTPSAAATSSNFTVKASDTSSPVQMATKPLSITINLSITTASPLPAGTVNSAYSQTLQSTGGTPPVTWSLSPETMLPQGLTLNATTGLISGTPTTAGDFTFTVRAADSSTPQQTATKSLMVTIRPALSITTTSPLPDGAVMTAYSATLQSSEGTPPVAWSVNNGTLPPGLVLSAAGQITGTPTTAGTFNFTVLAMDSSTPRQMVTKELSIKIHPAPLTITTTSLPNGTINTAYSATLQATGGTPPVTWSITTGTLPGGLTLNSMTGVISGTPTTAGTSTFTVQAADSASPPQTVTKQLSITINASSSNKLSGQYAFLFNGFDAGGLVAIAGSFSADGNGNITSGLQDVNRTSGVTTSQAFTGTYTVGADNRGSITLTGSTPLTTFQLALSGLVSGVATRARFIAYDNATTPAIRGSGVIEQQDPTAFSVAQITGDFAFGGTGTDPTFPRSGVAGRFTAAGGTVTMGALDINDAGLILPNAPFTGTYTVGSTGRGTLQIQISITGVPPLNFGFYVVSASELLFLSLDPRDTFGAISGKVLRQTPSPAAFTNNSLNGTAVLFTTALGGGGSARVEAGQLTFNPTTGACGTSMPPCFTLTGDQNRAGTILQNQTENGTYMVAPNGRATTASVNHPAAVYLVSQNKGFVLVTNNAVNVGFFEPQTATSLPANFAGSFGTVTPANASGTDTSGVVTLPSGTMGAGAVTGTSDNSSPGSAVVLGQAFSDTIASPGANGRITFTSGNNVVWIVSQSKAVLINIQTSNTNPVVQIIDKQ